MHKHGKTYIKIVNWSALIIIVGNLGLAFYGVIRILFICSKCLNKTLLITGIEFSILASAFGIVGFMILRRLRKYFREFYNQNYKMIMMATMGLFAPLLLRGVIDSERYYNKKFDDRLNANENISNFLLFIFCDVIPICF